MLHVRFVRLLLQSKKTALVTGANKGIGKEVVRQLATLGYEVYLGARNSDLGQKVVKDFHASGLTNVHLLVIDVTSDESVKAAAETLAQKISALDVLINNAGVSLFKEDPLQETIEEIKGIFEVNLFGVIRTTNAFVELLKKSKSGRIVNVSSGLGSLTQGTNQAWSFYGFNSIGYNPSKTALNGVSVAYAKALEKFNIKVNIADPGYTATEMNNNTGDHSVEVGAISTVRLATLPDDGPTASYENKDGVLPW